MMKIKAAMEECFRKQREFWKKTFNSFPKAPFADLHNNKELYIENKIDEYDYAEWQPKEQDSEIDEKRIEEVLGIRLRDELKEFYSAYSFLDLIGKMNNDIVIDFYAIPFGFDINDYIIGKHIESNEIRQFGEVFDKYDLFELGCASMKEMDGYAVCFDNNSGKIFLIYAVEQRIYDLNMTLYEMLNSFVEVF